MQRHLYGLESLSESQKERGNIKKDMPLPLVSFPRISVHFDKRTYSMRGECVSLYTLAGRQRTIEDASGNEKSASVEVKVR